MSDERGRRRAGATGGSTTGNTTGNTTGAVELRADCSRCFALCCVGPGFVTSADFAIDKAPGQPCPNLRTDSRCGIHERLRERGFAGCAAFDCFGAGQHVSQGTFGGRDWRTGRRSAGLMFTVFGVMLQLHESLWYLAEAGDLLAGPAGGGSRAGGSSRADDRGDRLADDRGDRLAEAIADMYAETSRLTAGTPDELAELDVAGHRRAVGELLARVSARVRSLLADAVFGGRELAERDLTRRDLAGQRLVGVDLRAGCLRAACLIGTDLRGADLRGADLLGADLRGADLRGGDLSGTLFLTQGQLESARGDAATRLPAALARPVHWSRGEP